jgi:hypothetical protein
MESHRPRQQGETSSSRDSSGKRPVPYGRGGRDDQGQKKPRPEGNSGTSRQNPRSPYRNARRPNRSPEPRHLRRSSPSGERSRQSQRAERSPPGPGPRERIPAPTTMGIPEQGLPAPEVVAALVKAALKAQEEERKKARAEKKAEKKKARRRRDPSSSSSSSGSSSDSSSGSDSSDSGSSSSSGEESGPGKSSKKGKKRRHRRKSRSHRHGSRRSRRSDTSRSHSRRSKKQEIRASDQVPPVSTTPPPPVVTPLPAEVTPLKSPPKTVRVEVPPRPETEPTEEVPAPAGNVEEEVPATEGNVEEVLDFEVDDILSEDEETVGNPYTAPPEACIAHTEAFREKLTEAQIQERQRAYLRTASGWEKRWQADGPGGLFEFICYRMRTLHRSYKKAGKKGTGVSGQETLKAKFGEPWPVIPDSLGGKASILIRDIRNNKGTGIQGWSKLYDEALTQRYGEALRRKGHYAGYTLMRYQEAYDSTTISRLAEKAKARFKVLEERAKEEDEFEAHQKSRTNPKQTKDRKVPRRSTQAPRDEVAPEVQDAPRERDVADESEGAVEDPRPEPTVRESEGDEGNAREDEPEGGDQAGDKEPCQKEDEGDQATVAGAGNAASGGNSGAVATGRSVDADEETRDPRESSPPLPNLVGNYVIPPLAIANLDIGRGRFLSFVEEVRNGQIRYYCLPPGASGTTVAPLFREMEEVQESLAAYRRGLQRPPPS